MSVPDAGLQAPDERPELTKNRIEALTDGVFAIAMTILVFNFRVPEIPVDSGREVLTRRLIELWPVLHIYIVSFLILGVFWVLHDAQFRMIKHSDRPLLWINIILLMFVALVPFTTELLGTYHTHRTAITIYALNVILVAVLLYVHWWYANGKGRLTGGIEPKTARLMSVQIFSSVFVSLLAMGSSFIVEEISKFVFLLVPLFYAIPRIIQYYRLRSSQQPQT